MKLGQGTGLSNLITPKEKRDFYEFALNAFVNKNFKHGFCALFTDFFKSHMMRDTIRLDSRYFPELLKYKPKKHFYNYKNEKTDDIYQFWFPIGTGDNKKRIKICKKILAKLG